MVLLALVLPGIGPPDRAAPPTLEIRSGLPSARPPLADTAEVLEEARFRQRAFERFRRRRLTWTWGRGGPPCDERIGRYCLWLGDDEEEWQRPDEPTEVTEARRALLAHLDSALAAAPASGWLADQRVRYLMEAGRDSAAMEAARECDAGPARCRSLVGFVQHHRGRFRAAERAFREAMAAMSPDTACVWRDLEVLYRDSPAPGYDETSCGDPLPMEEWIWRLGDPLWLVPGNDRLTEHFARHVRDRMQAAGAASAFGEPWGPDLREILLRYGWPVGFEQAHADVYDATASRPAVAHYPHWGMRYLPPALGDPEETRERLAGWDLEPGRPRSEHAPPYLRREMEPLTHQLARFPRGDSVRVLAAWRWPARRGSPAEGARGDSAPPVPPDLRDGLFVASPGAGIVSSGRELRREVPGTCGPGAAEGVRWLTVPRIPTAADDGHLRVVGIEAYSRADSAAARARYPLDPLGPGESRPLLSDLLLAAPGRDTVPATLGEAARCARPSGRVRPGDRLGLYWELHGGPAGPGSLETEVTVTATGGGVFRAIGEFLGLAGERTPVVAASWREPLPEEGSAHRRTLVIRVPADAGEGEYRIRLAIRSPAWDSALAAGRELEIRR